MNRAKENQLRFRKILEKFPGAVESHWELCERSDPTLALEMFCSDLCELGTPITQEIFDELQLLSEEWGANNDYVEDIRDNITNKI